MFGVHRSELCYKGTILQKKKKLHGHFPIIPLYNPMLQKNLGVITSPCYIKFVL